MFRKITFLFYSEPRKSPFFSKFSLYLYVKCPKCVSKLKKSLSFSKSKIFSPLDNMNESKLAILVNPIMVRIIFIFCEKKNMPFSYFLKKKSLPRSSNKEKNVCPVVCLRRKSSYPVALVTKKTLPRYSSSQKV